MPEIKASLSSYISKSSMSNDDNELNKSMQMLLNKLSNNNFNDIANDVKTIKYTKKKHIYKLCELIIVKSINEPTYCETYSKLCNALNSFSIIVANDNIEETIYFKSLLLSICKNMFESITEVKLNTLDDMYKSEDYAQLNITDLMRFIGELYNYNILNDKIINHCYGILHNGILNGKLFFDPISLFVKIVLKKIKKESPLSYDKYKSDMDSLLASFNFPNKLTKFKIIEVIEFIDTIN